MGRLRFHYCPRCNYGEMTSGGPDRGFQKHTNTFVCLECQRLCDCRVPPTQVREIRHPRTSWIGKFLAFIRTPEPSYEEDLPKIISYPLALHSCDSCGSKNLEVWDHTKKQCPKCQETMLIEEKYPPIMWD